MIVAITGCIGSGKSYICNLIETNFRYKTFSSDDFVKQAYEDEKILLKLDEAFNCVIDNKVSKEILKSRLADESIKKLNEIIHPFVKEKIMQIAKDNNEDLVFIEVPLLFETKMDSLFDYVIAISVDNENLRHKMLKNRNDKQYENMLKLEMYQLSDKEKSKKANFVINNNYNEKQNIKQLEDIINQINN